MTTMIKLNIDAHVATATLDRPPVNAIDHGWIKSLDGILDQIEDEEDVSVLHIRSKSKVFCAGADLALMRELLATPQGCDKMVELIRQYQRVLERLEKIGVITLAEIGGAALGGGYELALACDLRAASESAKLGLPEAGLGLIPGAGGTQRLIRICGEAIARRIILGAEVINGKQAVELGMVHWALPDNELVSWTKSFTEKLGEFPRQAVAACKHCIDAFYDDAVDGYQLELEETRRLYSHADTRQRVQAFLNK